MVMASTSSQNRLVNRIILGLLGLAVASLYYGANSLPHPDFLGQKDTYKAQNTKSKTNKNSPAEAATQPNPAADIAIPLKRPELASVWLNYNLPLFETSAFVPAVFTPTMPADIAQLSVQERKQLFVRIMLPLILAANERISAERALLSRADASQLSVLAKSYRLKAEDFDNDGLQKALDKRIRPLPVSLALAQAAIESGWGTSRFTREANALYGQWAWRAEDGVKPLEASNSRAVIRKFDTLQDSVHSYMKNLNSHYAYEDLRTARLNIYQNGNIPNGFDLAPYLSNYAETGEEYVETIKQVIDRNKFTNFERLSLASAG